MTEPAQPTAEELAQAMAVTQAAAAAAAGADNADDARQQAGAAVRQSAKDVKMELSDEDASKIVDMLIERMDAMGAFAPPPPPEPSPQPPASAEEPPPETPVVDPPRKRTFAEKFAGR